MMPRLLPLKLKRVATIAAVAITAFLAGAKGNAAEPVVVIPDQTSAQSGVASASVVKTSPKGFVRQSARLSSQHILVKLSPDAEESEFFERARGLGLRKLKRLANTDWYTVALPPNTNVKAREMALTVKGLTGVVTAVADPILHINDAIPPTDPFYVNDPDPGIDCDIIEDPNCDAEDLVDQWGLFQVDAESAWSVTTGSAEVVIAVIDSGVDLDHDDLWANIWSNSAEVNGLDGVDDDGNGKVDDKFGYDFAGNNVGSPDDDQSSEDANPDIFSVPSHQWISDPAAIPFYYRFDGDAAVGDGIDNNLEYIDLGFFTIDIGVPHGTAVAGVAAMMANNINPETQAGEGMAGVCWQCKIMVVRTINAEGEALGSDMVESIYYAVDNGAHIINASWGIPPGAAEPFELAPLEEAIQYAVNNGVVFIAAAGNSGSAGMYFPASMPETIAVGSSNWVDDRSTFSSYAQGTEVLDVVAPGELIWTSGVMSAYDAWSANYWLLFPELWYEPWRPGDDVYSGVDGTSFAAPLVSGYAALILSHNPCATPADVRQVIRDNAVDVATPGYDAQTGFGRVHMVVPDLGCGSTDAPPSVTVNVPTGPVSGIVEVTATASDDYGVVHVACLANGIEFEIDTDGSDGWSCSWDSTGSSDGTHTITATAVDTALQTASDSDSVVIDNFNEPPTASFSYDCTGLSCSFDGSGSSDPDPTGTITSHSWDFGDGNVDTTSGALSSHTYAEGGDGTYTVTLTITDNGGFSDSLGQSVVVNVPPPPTEPEISSATANADGTVTILWIPSDVEVWLQREKFHAKRGVWQNLTDLGSARGGTYTDASGSGTFHYRISADGGANWSAWCDDVIVTGTGGGGGGKGKPKK